MAAAPTQLTIRMYNVGFGDCFLLSFQYPNRIRHMLVDYGSTAAPKRGPANFMTKIANDIKTVTNGKLDVVVATHRHRDHISGFATTAQTGKTIAELNPDIVVQPWTEDPKAKITALTANSSVYTKGATDQSKVTAHFLGALNDMHRVAGSIAQLSARRSLAGQETREQLRFLGEDNLKNLSAVENLMRMAQKKAYYVNAGMRLNLLPGVKCTVLGPPTLKQSDAIRSQRSRDPDEFWQFRSFWASQSLGYTRSLAVSGTRLLPESATRHAPPPSVRWFVNQARRAHTDQMLSLVRDLDNVMNNTSVILLLEVGRRKILLPGDAQIENWAYALSRPAWRKLLADVNLYKVGHHGSLNATPKSLWDLFERKGAASRRDRLESLCSTKSGKHGSLKSGTEVPRRLLVQELERDSDFISTEEMEDSFSHKTQLVL